MKHTTTLDTEIDSLWVEIHFKENSIPSVIAGKLTEKSKQQIQTLLLDAQAEGYKRGYIAGGIEEFNKSVRKFENDKG